MATVATREPSTNINLTNWLPDWNSIDSVRLAHSRLELSSIAFFGLLALAEALAHKCKDETRKDRIDTIGIVFFVIAVICEGVAYPYGQRNDKLSENVVHSLSAEAQGASEAAGKANLLSGQAVDKANSVFGIAARADREANGALGAAGKATGQIAKVDAKIQTTEANVERVDEKFSFRTLDSLKRVLFINALKNAKHRPTEPVQIEAFMSVADGTTYGSEIADAMNDPSTGWKAGDPKAAVIFGNCKGVVLSVRAGGYLPPWALDLQRALIMSGIGGGVSPSRDQPEGTVVVLVCPKN